MSRRRKWLTAVSAVFLVVVIVVVATAGGGTKTPAGPFNGVAAKLKAATTAAVNNATASPGLAKPPSADCVGGSCAVEYAIKEPEGINYASETILPAAGVFRYAFSDAKVTEVSVTVSGPTTSVGGRAETSKLFQLTCSRRAAHQIDWASVSVSGLKQLCLFQPYVNNP